MSNARLIAHSTPVSTGGRTSKSGTDWPGTSTARSSSSSVVVGTTRRRQPCARQVSTSEMSSAVGSSKPVMTTSSGRCSATTFSRSASAPRLGESSSASPPACSLTVPITSRSGPRPSRRSVRSSAESSPNGPDEHRAAAHAEQPHQLERDAVVARAQERHEHRGEHERDPEDAVEAVERHAGDGHRVEGRDQRHERERADHRVGAGPRLALAVEARAREHEHEHERDELQPGRDRRPGQPEQHLLAAIGVAQHERGVERERDAGQVEQHQHERRQQPAPPMEEDERVEAEAAGADVVRGGCHVPSDGTPLPDGARLSPGGRCGGRRG